MSSSQTRRLAARSRPQGAGVPLRRPRLGREEHRGLPRDRPAGQPRRRRHRPRPAPPAGALPGRALRRRAAARRARAPVRDCRCVRVPEPHRHLRPGDARGARLRHAGGGLPGAGAARRRRQQRRSGAGRRPAPRCAPCAAHRRARVAGSTRSASRGARRRASSSICNRPSTAPRRRIACFPPELSPPRFSVWRDAAYAGRHGARRRHLQSSRRSIVADR